MKSHNLILLASGIILSIAISGCSSKATVPGITLYGQNAKISNNESSFRTDSIALCSDASMLKAFDTESISIINDVPTGAMQNKNINGKETLEIEYSHFVDGEFSSLKVCFEDKEKRVLKIIKDDKILKTEPIAQYTFGKQNKNGQYEFQDFEIACKEMINGNHRIITCSQK